MKYIVEILNPEYVEVEASSEEEATKKVKNNIQDPRLRDYVTLKICKEIKNDN